MSGISGNASNFCYRHPDRQSYVLCQRCGRTICPECQTPAAVGVHCPECVREQRAAFGGGRSGRPVGAPSRVTVARRRFALSDGKGTTVIVALTVLVWLIDTATNGLLTRWLAFNSLLAATQPWRLVTLLLVHSGFLHILFNMWTLWVFGRMVERMIGTWRFVVTYIITGLFSAMLVSLLAPGTWVVGASGAIFGLFVVFFILQRSLGNNAVQLLVLIALNLVIGFTSGSNISWQAHVGGIIGGLVVGYILVSTRNVRQRGLQIGLFVAAAVVAIIGTYVGYALAV